ncbi:MAG: hydantoinase/oxoprolinase family protein [Kiloniellales bacterium]
MSLRIAIDIGGTFTDGVLLEPESGRIRLAKSLTTPADPGAGLARVAEDLLAAQDGTVGQVVHGTTLITNSLLERKGARTALVTNCGMADALDIGRELRYDTYDLGLTYPQALVARGDRFELAVRMGPDGSEWQAANSEDLEALATSIADSGVLSVAVCLLHAPVSARQEQQVRQALAAKAPDLPVSLSAEVAGEIGEYERMSTTAANSYVRPLVERYLDSLKERLGRLGIAGRLDIMVSNGGFTTAEQAARYPIRLLESGPAGGVISAINCAGAQGAQQVLAFDMGGTTAKACVAVEGRPDITHVFEFAREKRFKKGSGLPAVAPSIDLIEIGAGGGSLARCDALGLLKVGPESAGSEPGPACYGLGGEAATVTDADLLLGYLDPDGFLGGRMRLYPEQARTALARVGAEVGLDALATAWGIHDIVNEAMASAARTHIAEKGLDARGFALVATGGAGPLHAVEVARRLRIRRILCPIASGVGSCLGFLAAPARADRSWSRIEMLQDLDHAFLKARLDQACQEIERELADSGMAADSLQAAAELRYRGQGANVEVAIDPRRPPNASDLEAAFLEAYAEVFGVTVPGGLPEAVTWRVWGLAGLGLRRYRLAETAQTKERTARARSIYLPDQGDFASVPEYDRGCLLPGCVLRGPCVICEAESTLVIARPADVRVLDDATIEVLLEEVAA